MSEKNRILNYRKGAIKYVEDAENPENNHTLALLRFDDESDPTKDELGNIWTPSAIASVSANTAKFGKALNAGSVSLSGVSYPLASGFTVDFWLYLTGRTNGGCVEFKGNYQNSYFLICPWHEATSGYYTTVFFDNNPNKRWSPGIPLVAFSGVNCWHHYAVTFSGSTMKYFLDGKQMGAIDYTSSGTTAFTEVIIYTSCGCIDEFRLSSTVRWTENFTPPTEPYKLVPVESSVEEQIKFYSIPTEPPRLALNGKDHSHTYAALVPPKIGSTKSSISNTTQTLLHFDKSAIYDETGRTWLTEGNPIITADNAKFGKSLLLDSNSYIYTEDFTLGGTDVTIDFWAKLTSSDGNGIFLTWNYSQGGDYRYDRHFGWNRGYLISGGNRSTVLSTSVSADWSNWNHYALVYNKSANSTKIFVNGKLVEGGFAFEISADLTFRLGDYVEMMIDDFRISTSVLWSEDFTPPTAPADATITYVDNPYASDLRVRLGTADDDIYAVAKSKKPCTLSLSTNAVNVTANSLAFYIDMDTNSTSNDVIVTSNKPEIVTASYSNFASYGRRIYIEAQDEAGFAVISVQVAENQNYEASPVQTITVGNYSFGALNTCTPTEIQACARLGLAPATWSVGDSTADIPIAKFQVGGYEYRYSDIGGQHVVSKPVYVAAAPHGHARILGFNHNYTKEGNNTIHFMYWGGTWLEAFDDKKNYGKIRNYSSATSAHDVYTFTHHVNTPWSSSIIRMKLLLNFVNAMDSSWAAVLAMCPKYTPLHDGEGAEDYTEDHAFILSEFEVFGLNKSASALTNYAAHIAESRYQEQYEFFKTFGTIGKLRAIKDSSTSTTLTENDYCDWWLRSPGGGGHCCVSKDGGGVEDTADSRKSLGIVPCFVIA